MDINYNLKAFAKRLYSLREQKGISARDMSLNLGQTHSYINSIENEKNFPTMNNFFYICEYLGVTPQEFFNYEDESPAQTKELEKRIQKLDGAARTHILGLIEQLEK